MHITELKEQLQEIEDPRRECGNKRHKLEDILIITPVRYTSNPAEKIYISVMPKEKHDAADKLNAMFEGVV